MILTGNWSTWRKTCPNNTSSTLNLTGNGLGWNNMNEYFTWRFTFVSESIFSVTLPEMVKCIFQVFFCTGAMGAETYFMSNEPYVEALRLSKWLNKGSECEQTVALCMHFAAWNFTFPGIWPCIEWIVADVGDNKTLRNVGEYLTVDTVSYARRRL